MRKMKLIKRRSVDDRIIFSLQMLSSRCYPLGGMFQSRCDRPSKEIQMITDSHYVVFM